MRRRIVGKRCVYECDLSLDLMRQSRCDAEDGWVVCLHLGRSYADPSNGWIYVGSFLSFSGRLNSEANKWKWRSTQSSGQCASLPHSHCPALDSLVGHQGHRHHFQCIRSFHTQELPKFFIAEAHMRKVYSKKDFFYVGNQHDLQVGWVDSALSMERTDPYVTTRGPHILGR
jgi:hypothetical protein